MDITTTGWTADPGPTTRRRIGATALLVGLLAVTACGGSATDVAVTPRAVASGVAEATAPVGAANTPAPAQATAGAGVPGPSASARPTRMVFRTPAGPLRPAPVASRVVVEQLGIDLPVVSSDLQPPPANYPLCDVAQYLTTYRNPGQAGSTYVYAHARDGMFGALFTASTMDDGASLIGLEAQVYRDDGQRFTYRITEVMRHATDYSLADSVAPGAQRLILQTSEGPYGTVPKLLVAAELITTDSVDLAEANPEARPRDCRPPQLIGAGEPAASGGPAAVASRVRAPGLGIDLPIVSSELVVDGNPPDYPLCDVAQYLVRYGQPGDVGTTYLYGHAQPKMFLPFLAASKRDDGKELIGERLEVYTTGGQRFEYEIFEVRRHAVDYALADETAPDEHRLVLQTSEGPNGTDEKLQVAARLVDIQDATRAEATPEAKPRACPPPGVVLATPTPNTGQSQAP
jgi:hypothetical protein